MLLIRISTNTKYIYLSVKRYECESKTYLPCFNTKYNFLKYCFNNNQN